MPIISDYERNYGSQHHHSCKTKVSSHLTQKCKVWSRIHEIHRGFMLDESVITVIVNRQILTQMQISIGMTVQTK